MYYSNLNHANNGFVNSWYRLFTSRETFRRSPWLHDTVL